MQFAMLVAPLVRLVKLGAPAAAPTAPSPYPISPLFFLALHMASAHLVARNFPAKSISYPAIMTIQLVGALAEHFTDEFPYLLAFMPTLIVPLFGVMLISNYIFAHRHTRGPKWLVWAAFGGLAAVLVIIKALDLPGIPPDDHTQLPAANKDAEYAFNHVFLQLATLLSALTATYHVPWSSDVDAAASPVLSRRPSAKDAIRFAVKQVKFA